MAVELRNLSIGNVKYLAPAYSDIVLEASGITLDFINNNYNVKYFLRIYIGLDLVAELKAPPNPNLGFSRAHFRIQSILQDYTKTDTKGYESSSQTFGDSTFKGNKYIDSPHSIHQIDKYSRNRDNLKYVFCVAGKEYSTTPNGQLIQDLGNVTDAFFLFFNSVIQHSNGYSSEDFTDYLLTGTNKKFLSIFSPSGISDNSQQFQKIQLGQYHTVAFLNNKLYNYEDIQVDSIRIQTFDSSLSSIETQNIENIFSNGGSEFGTTILTDIFTTADTVNEGLLYFGCGTAQLAELGFNMTNVKYYTVRARLGISGQPTFVSDGYTFEIQEPDCKGFETIRLAFLNRLGAWDYYNFTKKSVRTTQLVKSPIKQNYGGRTEHGASFGGALMNDTTYVQGTFEGGTRAYNVNAVETIEANTDFITEQEATILKELFASVDVYMQTGDYFEPVVINETEYIQQTTVNDKLIQYIIQIEKGHNTRVQRL